MGSQEGLAHCLNSKDFNCIQSVSRTEIRSHVVLVHQVNSRDLNCTKAIKLKEIGSLVVLAH